MDEPTTPQASIDVPQKPDPNQLLHDLLEANNLKLTLSALNDANPFVGTGFVLTDKPLLVVGATYKEENAGI